MDNQDDAKATLYVDDAIEVILLLVMFGTALWVRYYVLIHYTRRSIFLTLMNVWVIYLLHFFLNRCIVAFINLRSIQVQFLYWMTYFL